MSGASKSRTRPRGPISRPRAILSQIRREPNELKRKLILVGYLAEALSRKGEALFLVGGQAVETYTGGQFTTGDIDITTTDRALTEAFLGRLGFTREGMIWLNAKLGFAVHIVGSYPSRSQKARSVEVGPYKIRVTGVEDLIVDRLVAAKHWKSVRDAEQATALFRSFEESIDLEYLKKRAMEERVGDILPDPAKGSGSDGKANRGYPHPHSKDPA
jgi:hypothetical protein